MENSLKTGSNIETLRTPPNDARHIIGGTVGAAAPGQPKPSRGGVSPLSKAIKTIKRRKKVREIQAHDSDNLLINAKPLAILGNEKMRYFYYTLLYATVND
ncbi:hypothetical protein WN51_04708 [Melipona quadrifasciata]|uniref:Uncharacterized protein n=1 Tax=Melipona quadrifasciata TaxID=166423 RepID=A0A0M9AD60_9HYME|nr:hypothetical protein WN51_04708 [Melipona quadrifasciata]